MAKTMHFEKYHALGNDYLVLDPVHAPQIMSAEAIVRICHRNYGLGSDGILHGPRASDIADFGLRIYNPDGSEAEKSGNGLRIFCRYLFDQGKVAGNPFTVETPGGVVTCQVRDAGQEIEVEMGQVSFHSKDIPVNLDRIPREVINETIHLKDGPHRYCAATIGNPHAVLPMPRISREMALDYGPQVERHQLFPNRTNVQLLQVIDRQNIRIEIWERGAGYTLASGSSSSAAAAVARKLGLVDSVLTVHMPGGEIAIKIDEHYRVTMTGPATRVGTMKLDTEALA